MPQPLAAAAQATVATLVANSATPGDALRGLAPLASFTPVGADIGAAAVARTQTALLLRRAAVTAMVSAATAYQPASSQDAAAVRSFVVAFIDAEMQTAGDSGDDEVFAQMRALRTAVVDDLNSRGARLPAIRTVSHPTSLPAFVLAQRLYQDATREADLEDVFVSLTSSAKAA